MTADRFHVFNLKGPEPINVLALVKGEERYIFLYDDESRQELLRMLGRFASRKDLAFSWYDCAVLANKVTQGAKI